VDEKLSLCGFQPLWGLGGTVHPRLIGKLIVDLLFVLIELFRCVVRLKRLKRYERILIGNRRLKVVGLFGPNFYVVPTKHFLHG